MVLLLSCPILLQPRNGFLQQEEKGNVPLSIMDNPDQTTESTQSDRISTSFKILWYKLVAKSHYLFTSNKSLASSSGMNLQTTNLMSHKP